MKLFILLCFLMVNQFSYAHPTHDGAGCHPSGYKFVEVKNSDLEEIDTFFNQLNRKSFELNRIEIPDPYRGLMNKIIGRSNNMGIVDGMAEFTGTVTLAPSEQEKSKPPTKADAEKMYKKMQDLELHIGTLHKKIKTFSSGNLKKNSVNKEIVSIKATWSEGLREKLVKMGYVQSSYKHRKPVFDENSSCH